MLGLAMSRRWVWESRRLKDWVLQNAAIWRCIGSRRSHGAGATAPNFLKLRGRDIGTVVSSDSGPKLLTTSLVDSTKAVGVDNAWLVSNLGVDAKSVVRLR